MSHEFQKKGLGWEFFAEQVSRLRRNYGAASYPDESVKALYALLKHVSQNRFHQAINRILAENVSSKYPPGIERIERALENVREETWAEQKEKVIKGSDFRAPKKATLKKVNSELNKILNEVKNV